MEPTYLTLSNTFNNELPDKYRFNDVRYPKPLVEYFINQYTERGDLVFDPFCGFGTTLEVAKNAHREILGVEIHGDRVDFLRDKGLKEVMCGDISKLPISNLPDIDFLMTSPPFMGREDGANALTGYRYQGGYEDYLQQMRHIFKRLQPKIKENGHLVIEISNLKQKNSITTLAWDVGKLIAEIYDFLGEIIICWERDKREEGSYGYGYDHSYCLVYRKRG